MDFDQLRDRPSEAEFDDMIAHAHTKIRQTLRVESRPWWRRLSRLTTVSVVVVATGAVAGGAYAATQLFTPSPPPAVLTGSTVVKLDAPAAGDKWLNIQMAYTCQPGEHFTLKDGDQTIFDEDCDAEYYDTDESMSDPAPSSDSGPPAGKPAGGGGAERGVANSIPIEEVKGRKLVLDSTLSRDYRIEAVFSPTSEMTHLVLPGRRVDGQTDWATPDYTINKYGLTVGQVKVNTPEDQWPDLIPVTFKGREAYFLSEDTNGPIALDHAERKKDRDRQRREGLVDDKGNIYQKVYAADGKTVLGKMYIGTGSSS